MFEVPCGNTGIEAYTPSESAEKKKKLNNDGTFTHTERERESSCQKMLSGLGKWTSLPLFKYYL